MEISVVIPVFNRPELVARAINSVIEQSYRVMEVVVVDDGSTDKTAEQVEKNFPSASVIRQENRGVSSARNAGIAAATGDWIALLDSDDRWHRHKILRQVQALEKNPGFIACHTDESWIRNGRHANPMKKHAKPGGWIFDQCLPRCCVSPSSILLKKSVLTDEGMFDENLYACEDYDLWLRLFSKYPILLVPEKLVVKYGGHDDQLSRKFWGMDRFRVVALEKILIAGIPNSDHARHTRNTLIEKLGILINGFSKRGNHAEADFYQAKLDKWLS
jgi:glycosyltransferase involved in cell wall biosynthesis